MELNKILSEIEAEKVFGTRPQYGGNILTVCEVEDKPSKTGRPMLTLFLNNESNYFSQYPLRYWLLYDDKGIGHFKRIFNVFFQSNPGIFSEKDLNSKVFNERKFIGCKIGGILGEEKYISDKSGKEISGFYVYNLITTEKIFNDQIQIPPVKEREYSSNTTKQPKNDEDLPF